MPNSGGVAILSASDPSAPFHSAVSGRPPGEAGDDSEVAAPASAAECFFVGLGIDGLPGGGDVLEVDAIAAAELVRRIYILDARGLNRVHEPGRELGSVAEIDQFVPYPKSFLPEDASGNDYRMLILGSERTGEISLAEFDGVGISISPLTKPGGFGGMGGRVGPARAAILAEDSDHFVVALRDDKTLYLGLLPGNSPAQIRYAAPLPLVAPRGRPYFVRSAMGLLAVQEEAEPGSAPRAKIARVSIVPGDAPRLEWTRTTSIELLRGEHICGVMPKIAVDQRPSLLVATSRSAREIPLDESDADVPLLLAAWNTRDRRFEWPLLAHLLLYMFFGFVGRRPPILKRVFVYRPAAFLRRALAFIVDGLVALVLTWIVLRLALDLPELELLERGKDSFTQPLSSGARILEAIVFETVMIFILVGTMVSAFFECVFGRSIGKKLFQLQVMSLDGDPPSVGAVMTRNVMLFVDLFPLTGFIGVLFAALSRRRQRLGDLFAGVVVVDARSVMVRAARPEELKLFQP